MWKKIFAAGLFATVGSALFFGAQDASAALWAEDYTSGDWTNVESRTARICVDGDAGQDYGETPIIAEIRAANYLTQFSFDDLSEWTCYSLDNLPDNAEARYIVPVSKRNSLSIEHTFPMGGSTKTMTLQFGSIDDEEEGNYLWAAGTSAQGVAATSASVMFDANGGTGVMPVITGAEVGSSVNLPKSTLTRAGYKFAGWNTKADGTGTPYADEAAVPIAEIGVVTLFAQWDPMAVLDSGYTVGRKLKAMSNLNGTSTITWESVNNSIKAVKTADSLPVGFDTSRADNIISADSSVSPEPIYAWFDNNDNDNDGVNDGIIYVYSRSNTIYSEYMMNNMFYNMRSLEDISGVANWNTSGTSRMEGVFGHTAITSASALANWDTSNVISMSELFADANRLVDISALSGWDTSRVGDMHWLFYGNESLVDISALSSWDTANVKKMNNLFAGSTSLANISALSSWNTSRVTDMSGAFQLLPITNVDALETKQYPGNDYVSWDVSNVEKMDWMFHEAKQLVNISALASWDTSSATDMSNMLDHTPIANTNALETKQYPGKDYVSWDVSKVANLRSMFNSCESLVDISALASWNTSSVADLSLTFYNAGSLANISSLANWNTSSLTNFDSTFALTAITNVDALETKQYPGNDYTSWDVSNVTTMFGLFSGDVALIDISALASWNISSLKDATQMFSKATSLADITALASWNTSGLESIYGMFREATSLASIMPLENWDTSSLRDMGTLFYNNTAITDLSAIKYWNTSRVTSLNSAFRGTRITDVEALRTMRHEGKDYVSWDVSNVTDVICTFEYDYWLTDISALDSWNIQSGAGMTRRFNGVPATPLPDWYNE